LSACEFDGEYHEPLPFGEELGVIPIVIEEDEEEIIRMSEKEYLQEEVSEVKDIIYRFLKLLNSFDEHMQNVIRSNDAPKIKKHKMEEPHHHFVRSETKRGVECTFNVTSINLRSLPIEAKRSKSCCYICHTPDVPGKFDPKKAMALGKTKNRVQSDYFRPQNGPRLWKVV
jgi:hypothetical protein